MDLTRLPELKRKLLTEQNLGQVFAFFLDHFGDDPKFIALGQRVSHEMLEAILGEVAKQLVPRGGALKNLLLTQVPDQPFIHGGFTIGNQLGCVLWFEDAQVGLASVSPLPPAAGVRFARFSGQAMRPPIRPSDN